MKKKKNACKRGKILLCILSVGYLLQTGCAKETADPTEITLIHGWGSTESDHVAMRQIYENFAVENPDIQLNLISMPSSEDVISKTEDMISVGRIPDMIFTGGAGKDSIYGFMVENRYALDLMPYIEADAELQKDIADTTLNYWKTDENELYTVSDVLLMSGYWYNADIFFHAGISQPPKTWDEFLEDCQKIQKWAKESEEEVIPVMLDSDHILYLTDALLASEDALNVIKESGVSMQDNAFSYAAEKIRDIYAYSKDVESDYTYRDTLQSFNDGNTAFYINGVWANTMISKDMNVKYAAFPSLDGSGIACVSSASGYILGNTGDEKKQEACIRFIKYMLSDEVQQQILEQTGQIPSSPAIELSNYEETNQRFYQAVECMLSAEKKIDIPANIWSGKLSDLYTKNMTEYLNDKITTETLCDRIR